MQRLLLALGVLPAAIWLEARSVNTSTNASESAALLRARGVGTIVLAASALHMPRARANFERLGTGGAPRADGLRSGGAAV